MWLVCHAITATSAKIPIISSNELKSLTFLANLVETISRERMLLCGYGGRSLAISLLAVVVVGQDFDGTVRPLARGASIVETVCSRIESSCIFPEDKLFLRRLAYVESSDGSNPDTFRSGYHGGIWQVTLLTMLSSSATRLLLCRRKMLAPARRSFLSKPIGSFFSCHFHKFITHSRLGLIPFPCGWSSSTLNFIFYFGWHPIGYQRNAVLRLYVSAQVEFRSLRGPCVTLMWHGGLKQPQGLIHKRHWIMVKCLYK